MINGNLTGVIIEESLEDISVLNKVKVIETIVEEVTEEHKTPWLNKWTIHTVEIEDNIGDELSHVISSALESQHDWYVDYRNDKFHYVIFRGKVFKIDRSKSYEYEEIKRYGVSKGIPDYQLDFSYHIEEWKKKNKYVRP